jgi:Tfp pilus assembly protein PilF
MATCRSERAGAAVANSPAAAALHLRLAMLAAVFTASGCATAPGPVSKIVNGHIVVTRAIGPDAYEHVARAELFEEDQRWGDAARELERALQFDDQGAEIRAELAEVYLRLGRLDDAGDQVERSVATAPTVAAYLAAAHLAEARHDDAAALGHFRTAASQALDDGDVEAIEDTHLALGNAQLAALDLPAARATIRALRDAVPDNVRAGVELGAISWAEGHPQEAEAALVAALAIEPEQIDARLMLAALRVATGRAADAKATFRQALERSEDAADVAEMFLRWLSSRGDKVEAAAEADRLTPDVVEEGTIDLIVRLERAAGRPERARLAAEEALRKGVPAGRVALLVGGALTDSKDFAGAAARLLKVGRRDSEFVESRLRAVEALRRVGGAAALKKADGALDEATSALGNEAPSAAGPGRPAPKAAAPGVELEGGAGEARPPHDWASDLIVARALLDEKRGDPARAARGLDLALEKDPDNARFRLVRAAIDERRGDWRPALAQAEKILRGDPRNVEVLNFCGFVAADHDLDLPKATRRLQVAMVLNPGAGGIVDSLGWARLHAGDLPAAAELLTAADRLEPGDPEILSHLGELYSREKQIERAVVTYRKALQYDPDERVARDIEKHLRSLESMNAAKP